MHDLPHTLKIVTVWLLLGAAVFLGVKAFERQQGQSRFVASAERIEIRRGPDGHYHWPGRINGRTVDFLVDTGATGSAMPSDLASELGLESIGRVSLRTAAGNVTGGLVRADVSLDGGVEARGLRITTLPQLGDRPLLGMDILGRLSWTQSNGVLTIDGTGANDRRR